MHKTSIKIMMLRGQFDPYISLLKAAAQTRNKTNAFCYFSF